MNEIIYILINEAMPGLCKIGYTSQSIEARLRELSRHAGVPLPFECFYAKKVNLSALEIEQWLHELFDRERLNPKKEFFTTSPEKVALALRYIDGEEIILKRNIVTESKQEAEAWEKVTQRRAIFNFKMVDIPVGAELVFSRDENIKAKVIDNRWIEFNGERTSLALSARKILGYDYPVSGALYWMYDSETLDERRRRFESGE